MFNIGVVGTNEFVLGFRLAGIRHVAEATQANFLATVKHMMEQQDLGIIVVDEKLLNLLESSDIYDLERSVRPVIIGVSESAASDNLRRMIKKSVGVDLWKDEE